MTTVELLWNGLAAFLTLCTFSFLYKDNPFYKFAEQLVAGVALGYWTMLLYHTTFTDKVLIPIFREGKLHYIFPTILGIMMWTRFSRKLAYLSRIAIAFYIGIGTGVALPLFMYNYVFRQLQATVVPLNVSWLGFNSLLMVVFIICTLIYFFFSKEHTGAFGGFSRVGIYTLMVGFGASFGLTVMGRVALLVQRIIFIREYFIALFGS
jgi:hypothetical protein